MALQDVAAASGISAATMRDTLGGVRTRDGCGQVVARLVASGGAAAITGLAHRGRPPPVTRLAAAPSTTGGYLDTAGLLPLSGTARWAARLPPGAPPSTSEGSSRAGPTARADCPGRLVAELAQDDDAQVRAAVAARVDCPTSLISTLAQDEGWPVRAAVAGRDGCTASLIAALAQDDEDVRAAVAGRADCPPSLIPALAQDAYWEVRVVVAGRGDCPPDVDAALSADPW